jgi:hypothetical protein
MSAFEQLELIKKNVANIHCPHILKLMNEKARILQEEIDKIKTLKVTITLN